MHEQVYTHTHTHSTLIAPRQSLNYHGTVSFVCASVPVRGNCCLRVLACVHLQGSQCVCVCVCGTVIVSVCGSVSAPPHPPVCFCSLLPTVSSGLRLHVEFNCCCEKIHTPVSARGWQLIEYLYGIWTISLLAPKARLSEIIIHLLIMLLFLALGGEFRSHPACPSFVPS